MKLTFLHSGVARYKTRSWHCPCGNQHEFEYDANDIISVLRETEFPLVMCSRCSRTIPISAVDREKIELTVKSSDFRLVGEIVVIVSQAVLLDRAKLDKIIKGVCEFSDIDFDTCEVECKIVP
jgi:hypothetical protein